MAPPVSKEETDADEPSSYEHIESALNRAAARGSSKLNLGGMQQVSEVAKPSAGESLAAGKGTTVATQKSRIHESVADDQNKTHIVDRTTSDLPEDGIKGVVLTSGNNVESLMAITSDGTMQQDRVPPSITITKTTSQPRGAQESFPQSPSPSQSVRGIVAPRNSHADQPEPVSSSGSSPKIASRTRYSLGTSGLSSKAKTNVPLRRGKWTAEEEAYVARVIKDFNAGILNAPAGTTLRSYLSEKLQCDPMRITKKFTGDACIGKRVFHPTARTPSNAAMIDKAQAELDALRKRWHIRLEAQQRESAKKVAATPVQSNGRISGITAEAQRSLVVGVPAVRGASPTSENVVTRTAAWLDQANTILSVTNAKQNSHTTLASLDAAASKSTEELGRTEIENQMKEVQRLISEGPQIQQTTAGLSHMLAQQPQPIQPRGISEDTSCNSSLAADTEPADKRMRRTAEDAEALVGFLRSVRASAASGLTE